MSRGIHNNIAKLFIKNTIVHPKKEWYMDVF